MRAGISEHSPAAGRCKIWLRADVLIQKETAELNSPFNAAVDSCFRQACRFVACQAHKHVLAILANAFGAADTEANGLDVLFDFLLVVALDVGHKFTAMELNLFVWRVVSHSLVG